MNGTRRSKNSSASEHRALLDKVASTSSEKRAITPDVREGTASNRRLFVDMNQHPGRPDGAAVDADGCYWTCANDAGQLLRFTPEGKLDRSITLPVKKPSMCAFGGERYDTLYVTSIRPQSAADLAEQPDAGAVFAVHPGIQGLPEAEFGRMQ